MRPVLAAFNEAMSAIFSVPLLPRTVSPVKVAAVPCTVKLPVPFLVKE